MAFRITLNAEDEDVAEAFFSLAQEGQVAKDFAIETLEQELEMTDRQVVRSLSKLSKLGVISFLTIAGEKVIVITPKANLVKGPTREFDELDFTIASKKARLEQKSRRPFKEEDSRKFIPLDPMQDPFKPSRN